MGNHFSEGLLGKSEKDLFEVDPNTIKDEEISSDLPNYEPFCCCCRGVWDANDFRNKGEKKKLLARDIDNIIHKIKSFFINSFLIDFIEKHSNKKNIKLKKIYGGFIRNLKKNENLALFNKKISDIFYEEKISYKYKYYNRYENRAIIEKIYAEKEEINIIKILELTFEELFIIFRRKLKDKEDMKKLEEIKDKIEGLDLEEKNNKYLDIEYFIERIRQKDSIFYRSIMDEYIEKIKSLCLGYEEWFKNKNERNTKSS